jgi:hypothetical protein
MKESPVLQHELEDAPSEPAARRRLGATSHAAARRNSRPWSRRSAPCRFFRSQPPTDQGLRKSPQDSPQAGLNLGRATADHGPPTPDQESRSLVSWLPPSRRFSKRQTRRKSGTQSHRAFGPVPAGPWQPGSRNEATAFSPPVHARLPRPRNGRPGRPIGQPRSSRAAAAPSAVISLQHPVVDRAGDPPNGDPPAMGKGTRRCRRCSRTGEPDRSRRSQPATSWRVIDLPFPQFLVPLEP